jgi:hypothetical protein
MCGVEVGMKDTGSKITKFLQISDEILCFHGGYIKVEVLWVVTP